MTPEIPAFDKLRQAILEDMPLPLSKPPTPENEAHQIVDFAIQLFLPIAGDVEKNLEEKYGEKLGMEGKVILQELRLLALSSWNAMGEEQRRPFGTLGERIIERIKESLKVK